MTHPDHDELVRLRRRVQDLSRQKSQLEVVLHLLDELAPVSGLEATVTRVLELVMNTIGGTNVALYYQMADTWAYADIHGVRETRPTLASPIALEVVSSARFVETAADGQTIVPEDNPIPEPTARTWGFPLPVEGDTIGCLVMEGVLIEYHPSIQRQFEVFTRYLALALRNEIRNYRTLEKAYENLRIQHDTLKRVSAEWRRTEDRLERAQRVGRMGSWEIDFETRKAYWSEGMYHLCGLPPPPDGRPPEDFGALVHPDDQGAYRASFRQAIRSHDPFELSFRLILPDGAVRHLAAYGQFTNDRHEGGRRMVGVVRDVTAQAEAAEQKTILEAQLRQTQKMEALGTLAGGIAHDFNNVLSGILGYTELTRQRLPPASEEHRNLGHVLEAVGRARDLVQQILTFSRRTAERKEAVEFAPLLEEALELLGASIPKTIEIRASVDPAAGWVHADPTQIHQVILNLCTNAYHAMRESGGVLEVTLGTTEGVRAQGRLQHPDLHEGPHLCLTVSDTGPGLDPEVIPRVFDPFFTTKPPGEGTGMGLAVAHGIVKGHGGTIEVANRRSGGARFTVHLPVIQADESKEKPVRESAPGGTEHLLVVDDEPTLVEVETLLLESLGYRVTGFTEARSALAAFQADPESFDLLLCDQTMPGMTGTQLTREILSIRPELPVVLCTGHSATLDATRAHELGARHLLMKPVKLDDLAAAVRTALDTDEDPEK